MPRFRVFVPFEPVIHESLESRSFTEIPDCDLPGDVRIRRGSDGYTADLEVAAERPSLAKAAAIIAIERFLAVLASWNYAFQIVMGGVRADLIELVGEATVGRENSGAVEVAVSDTVFVEGHIEAVHTKESVGAERDFYGRYDELPEYVRSCLELNYLLVLSTRPPNRWLLAATGLEALAVGALGAQPNASGRLTPVQRRQLQREIAPILDAVGLGDLAGRISQRVLSTTTGPVAQHVHAYLQGLGVSGTTAEQINHWWRTRGSVAHGAAAEIDQSDLNHLITVFQSALRRTAGAEPTSS